MHTPGPWKAAFLSPDDRKGPGSQDRKGYSIEILPSKPYPYARDVPDPRGGTLHEHGPYVPVIARIPFDTLASTWRDKPWTDFPEANAALLLASPDLLEAAEELVAALDHATLPPTILQKLQLAIQKARTPLDDTQES